jgi:hypothetical protein
MPCKNVRCEAVSFSLESQGKDLVRINTNAKQMQWSRNRRLGAPLRSSDDRAAKVRGEQLLHSVSTEAGNAVRWLSESDLTVYMGRCKGCSISSLIMHLYLSSNEPWNATYANEEGQAIYKILALEDARQENKCPKNYPQRVGGGFTRPIRASRGGGV